MHKLVIVVAIAIATLYFVIRAYTYKMQHAAAYRESANVYGFDLTMGVLPVCNSQTDLEAFHTIMKLIDVIRSKNTMMTTNIVTAKKLSVKLCQLSSFNETAWRMFVTIVDYANKYNIFVWISAVRQDSLQQEYNTYQRIKSVGYTNVGLTLATYHTSVHTRLDVILNNGGHVRLVKGHYRGDITDWSVVTANYMMCALKLIDSGLFHTLATHDFKLLQALHQKRPYFVHTINFAFYYSAMSYVNTMLSKMPFVPMHKSLYLAFGQIIPYLYNNVYYIDIAHHTKRTWNIFWQ